MHKLILDACCGGRMFWEDRKNPNVLFVDNRIAEPGHLKIPSHVSHCVKPDMVVDFRKMPFHDKSFKMVVFDPPHLITAGPNSWQARKYGKLADNWRDDISKGFSECWRVLDDYGTLIFKWSEVQVPIKSVLELFPVRPLFGHLSGKSGKTIWAAYLKIPALLKEEK